MLLAQAIDVLEQLAPTRYAEAWDNVGLLAGDPAQPVCKAMLTIDYTPQVAAEVRASGCDLVVAYHPPIFEAVKHITAGSLIFNAIRHGVAIYSPHTALDVAAGGTNDMLADAVGLTDRMPLRRTAGKTRQYKLVAFVPADHIAQVSQALFVAGAGRIGNYSHCSFRTGGTGTFFGENGANPTIGKPARLQEVPEVRLECVVPIALVKDVVDALRRSHPYETPAFDLLALAEPPDAAGQGRIGSLPPTPCNELIQRIKRELGIDHLLVAGSTDRIISRAAVCAGACGDLLDDCLAQKADLYLTGELRHHAALKAQQCGVTVACTLHSNSERPVLHRLAKRLREQLPGLEVLVSRLDRDPFRIA